MPQLNGSILIKQEGQMNLEIITKEDLKSPGTLQNLRINGTLNFTRIGSIIYYKQEDINKLLEGGLK